MLFTLQMFDSKSKVDVEEFHTYKSNENNICDLLI